MGRPCTWCGVFIADEESLKLHESIHRNLDFLNGTVLEPEENRLESSLSDQDINESESCQRSNHCSLIYYCNARSKSYSSKLSLERHRKADHTDETFPCSKCTKTFRYESARRRHEKTCAGIEHVCHKCNKLCSTAHGLRRHLQSHGKAPQAKAPQTKAKDQTKPKLAIKTRSTPPAAKLTSVTEARPLQFRCRRCSEVFDNRHDLYLHSRHQHYNQAGGALQPRPWGRDELPPWDGNDALREVYEANAPHILENHNLGPLRSVYNFPLTNDVDLNQLMRMAEDIYRQQQRAFQRNLVFGVILENRETGRYRYFVPYSNNGIFERPLYISRRVDLQRFRRDMERKDIMTELLRNRPDTKWIPVLVTNVHFLITETYYPLGQGKLPDFLLKKNSLYPLVKNQHNGKLYKDSPTNGSTTSASSRQRLYPLIRPYFPYEWFDDIRKLAATSLPPHQAFYSHLKGINISDEEYMYCQKIWQNQQMTTFRDFLISYNNLDVKPFVEAVEKFQQFYFQKGVDVFKTAISVPGIARHEWFDDIRKLAATSLPPHQALLPLRMVRRHPQARGNVFTPSSGLLQPFEGNQHFG